MGAVLPLASRLHAIPWSMAAVYAKLALRWLAHHTGLPALIVAAIAVAVGYRILKKTARFAVEVALVAALLIVATEAGFLRW